MRNAFGILARFRRLRGTPFDPFRGSPDRRLERRLLAEYRETLKEIVAGLTAGNHGAAVALARYPETIRGYGHVKQAAAERADSERASRLATFVTAGPPAAVAAE